MIGKTGELERQPELANQPKLAAQILAAFLATRRQPIKESLLDGDLARARRLVNGGRHGLDRFAAAYAIGIAKPVSINVNTFGTGKVSEERLVQLVEEVFDLRPKAIIQQLNLLRPIYRQTAAYGHFGRELPDFTWERTDKAEELKSAAGI